MQLLSGIARVGTQKYALVFASVESGDCRAQPRLSRGHSTQRNPAASGDRGLVHHHGVARLFGLVGAVLAMVTRSAAISIATGVAYLLIVENLFGLIWDGAGEWLPAGVFSAFAGGGTSQI